MTSNTMRSILGGGATRAGGDVAERQVLTIEEDATVLDALMKMRKYRIQVLAVVKDGKLVGEMSLRILIDELLRLLRVGGPNGNGNVASLHRRNLSDPGQDRGTA